MKLKNILTDFSLLKVNTHFRNVFIARTVSLLTIGMLIVAIPQQVYQMTQDVFQVAIVTAFEGIAMFIGLLLGGVLSDRYDRKKLILFARLVCGLGFMGLAVNAMLDTPSLYALYFLSAWDGFFGALGVTAMMAIMPIIVGRENIVQARAISMVSVRLATVISPAIGGIVIAASSVAWAYWIATLGTLFTVLLLLGLPVLKPQTESEDEHPVQQLLQGFKFVFQNKVVGSTILIGTILGFTSAIRILFPQIVDQQFAGGAFELGLMYSAVPLGATLGALLSGWTASLTRPGTVMIYASLAVFACMFLIGLSPWLLLTLVILSVFGYLSAIANLLQYSIVQGHTPDEYLGRINAIWLAQDASSDSIATTILGALTRFLPISSSIFIFSGLSFALGLGFLMSAEKIRDASFNDPDLQQS
ncbi:enterobactin transporter EntS [Acinetobacter vivianii]|uniref:enterobactin transporter EntS n=1 Tax=Acinetobacter vivianii TaxID=1776742 RepID=UPI002DB827A1|nr:enterobactin transporter EntS [Acinetobacter vivianii]MEB6478866.1 enterobactin transporter EntS [Acinetobacter vivianii]MEB6657302.1 enterobactin transporter EntS [Acinetobacter vivianii]